MPEFRVDDVICKIGDTSLLSVVAVGADSYCLMKIERPFGLTWLSMDAIDRNCVLVERKGT
jgi:hypothetical protein